MTKKDFELIAKILHLALTVYTDNTDENKAIIWTCKEFANHMSNLYPRFNKEKFLQSCGVGVGHKCTFGDDSGYCWTCKKFDDTQRK